MDVVYHIKQLSLEINTLEVQLRDKKSELEKLMPALSDQERLLMDLPPTPKEEKEEKPKTKGKNE
jgi:hypothetical protein